MVKFSGREIRDLILSMFVIAGVFSYVFSGRQVYNAIQLLPVSIIAVGLGFVFHEIAHKLTAIRYGFWAEYKLWMGGLLLAILTAYFGFVFAAPGAVYIHGPYIGKEENGKISLAGPATNILLALFFLFIIPFLPSHSILAAIAILGCAINSFLAFFNLIPFAVLDGAKVIRWNPMIWFIAMIIAFALTFKSMFTPIT